MMDLQTAFAVIDSAEKAIKAQVDLVKPALVEEMTAAKAKTLEASLDDRRIGSVTLCRRASGSWEVVDRQAFELFARESLTVETVTVDASRLPHDVLQTLRAAFPDAVTVERALCDWRPRVTATPAGPMLDTGELVPGVAWVESETLYPRFTPDKKGGWDREKVLAEAIAGGYIGQALALDVFRPVLEGGDDGR